MDTIDLRLIWLTGLFALGGLAVIGQSAVGWLIERWRARREAAPRRVVMTDRAPQRSPNERALSFRQLRWRHLL